MPLLVRIPAGGGPPERYPLKAGSNTIGRSRENDIVLHDASLSRVHARVDVEEGGSSVLGSRNGTFVGGLRVLQCRLKHGDAVQLGELTLRFEEERTVRPSGFSSPELSLDALIGAGGEIDKTSAIRLKGALPMQRSEAKLKILLTVSQILSSPEPVDAILPRIVDLLLQILDVHRVALLLVEEGSAEPVAKVVRSRKAMSESESFFSRSIVRLVFERGEGLVSDDALVDPRFAASATVAGESIRSSMAAPLKVADKVIFVDHPYDATVGADALVLVTEWQEYRSPDLERLSNQMRRKLLLDGRNVWAAVDPEAAGFTYEGIGLLRPKPAT